MTHKEKVLRLLSDGEPHSHLEGYRLGVMLHSRVAELRTKDGYTIKCWHEDGKYWYQLFGTVQGNGAETDGVSVPRSPGPSRHGPPETPSVSQTPSEADGVVVGGSQRLPCEGRQLSVFEAAA